MEPKTQTHSNGFGWFLCALGWFIIVIGVLVTVVSLIPGLIGVVFGMFFILKYSPKGSVRPIYKRKWPVVVSLLWALSAFANLTAPDVPEITSLSIDCESTIQLDISETATVPLTVEEENADTNSIQFYSSDNSVVTFSAVTDGAFSGQVTPCGEGKADISITAGEVQSNVIHVTVIDSARIAAEEAAKKAAEEEAARKAAEEEAARKAAEEEAARIAAEEEAAHKAAEETAAQKEAEEAAAQQQQQSQSNSRTVYITPTGKKYHYDNNCNGGTYSPSTLAKAQAMGLTPCKKCAGG